MQKCLFGLASTSRFFKKTEFKHNMEGCIEINIKLLPQLTNVSMEHKVSL